MLWNTTWPKEDATPPDGWFDYYTGPAPNWQQVASLGAFLGDAVSKKNTSTDVCSSGWNCTYEVQFTGPGLKCTDLASGVGKRAGNLTQESGTIAPPFNTDILLPEGTFSYYAFTSGGEYSTIQLDGLGIAGVPDTKPPYPKNFGALRTEPVVWIGHSVLVNTTEKPQDRNSPTFRSAFIPKLFACEHYETAYKVQFNYSDGSQLAVVTNRTFLNPIINTTYLPDEISNDGTKDNATAHPQSNYIFPTDVARYRRTAAYHSLGAMLRAFINGTVQIEDKLVNPVENTAAIQTKLLDPSNNYFAFANLKDLVQGFYEDIILSLFSNPQFVEVVWAARPDEQTGTRRQFGTGPPQDYLYPCTRTRTANMYSYHERDLWIVYGIAVALALASLVAGAFAIHENGGVVRNTRFSSIVAATRGPPLEKVNWDGPEANRGDIDASLKQIRLGYGTMLLGESGAVGEHEGAGYGYSSGYSQVVPKPGETRYGFGAEGDVNQLRREGSIFRRGV